MCVLRNEVDHMFITIAHVALYDGNPHQFESLSSIHQSLCIPGNGIDDRARCENDIHGKPGTQCSKF